MSDQYSYFNSLWEAFNEVDSQDCYSYDKENKTKGVEKELNKLGEVLVVKNELSSIFDGETIMLCPGYDKTNVKVVEKFGESTVWVVFDPISDNVKGDQLVFSFNPDYEHSLSYNIKNGVLKLKAKYEIKTNVAFQEEL